jgi:predicted RNA polymerase sigma factor
MSDEHLFAEADLRELVPAVIGILLSRGADFPAAEDAVQDALVEALDAWRPDPPRDRRGWLVTVAWRKFLDGVRADRIAGQTGGTGRGRHARRNRRR